MYERFTDRARRVMQLANQEAQRLNHEYIGAEHILLGLLKEGSGVAANALRLLHVDPADIRKRLEQSLQPGPDMVTMGKLPQTPRTKKVLEHAMSESESLGNSHVGTEHILLGLLHEPESAAGTVLTEMGLTLNAVREAITGLFRNIDVDRVISQVRLIDKLAEQKEGITKALAEARRSLSDYLQRLRVG